MSIQDLRELNKNLLKEQFEVMQELARRGVGKHAQDTMEHPEMRLTEDDF
jgi:ribosomal protein L29